MTIDEAEQYVEQLDFANPNLREAYGLEAAAVHLLDAVRAGPSNRENAELRAEVGRANDEVRRLRAEVVSRHEAQAYNALREENEKLRAEIDRLRVDRGNLMMAARRALSMHARGDDEHALDALRKIVRDLSRPEDVMRNSDHADTTQDTTKTRCARDESETSTSAADPAESEASGDGQDRENS